jgi:nucleoside recognition membrane protein YjiH
LGAVGSLAACAIIVEGTAENVVIDVAFLVLMIPALAIDGIGSTVLGIALLRGRYEPKITAWLLILVLPSIVVLSEILGNLSFGLLPVFAAWAATGWRLWRTDTAARPTAAVH